MAELLIEILSEEIPARMQPGAERDFARLMEAKLKAAGVAYEALTPYVGPRRLVLVGQGLPLEQAATSETLKGPREGAPQQALDGFLRKAGVTQDQLKLENEVWVAEIHRAGRQVSDILSETLGEIMQNFPWPKSMRSGVSNFRWVRPIKSILFVLDGKIVPFELDGMVASNTTRGHRFLSSGDALVIRNFENYRNTLADNSVILDHVERQASIQSQAKAVCQAAGCELIEDQGLLEEVAGLNEFPVAILGDMDPKFLTLPPEVIKTSMRTHQKYFAVRGSDGNMAPHFVIVANMKAIDDGIEIKRGNAKVLSARLSDGVFFYESDQKPGNFERWNTKLTGVTFHARLGTMAARVERITALAVSLAGIMGLDPAVARQAAQNCKADLASSMVGEFPELQGIMGGYYARAAGMGNDIADAIRDHYKPLGPTDSLPATKLGACLALADKLDTLIGFFAIDEKPTGSKDPYALRRSALGIIRILRHFDVKLSIVSLVTDKTVSSELQSFFLDRLKVMLRDEGLRHDVIEAAVAVADDDLLKVINRAEALEAVLKTPEGDDLAAVYKRSANILTATKSDWQRVDSFDQTCMESVEIDLAEALKIATGEVSGAVMGENYREAFKGLAALRKNVDSFLDQVLVNAEDVSVRNRRLSMLVQVCDMTAPLADLSKLA